MSGVGAYPDAGQVEYGSVPGTFAWGAGAGGS